MEIDSTGERTTVTDKRSESANGITFVETFP
jgi:hypothetical protein